MEGHLFESHRGMGLLGRTIHGLRFAHSCGRPSPTEFKRSPAGPGVTIRSDPGSLGTTRSTPTEDRRNNPRVPSPKGRKPWLKWTVFGTTLAEELHLPLWEAITDRGLSYPSVVLVEFDPQASWYEAVVTLTAQALRLGKPTDVHVFTRLVNDATSVLSRLGLDVPSLLASDQLRIIDSYTAQTGTSPSEAPGGPDSFMVRSVKLSDWGDATERLLKSEVPESDKGRLHIEGNLTVLASFNPENEILAFWRTRLLPLFHRRGSILVVGVAVGVCSDSFYRQLEALCDGIVEFRGVEEGGRIEQRVRVKAMRGRPIDSRWRQLKVSASGELSVAGKDLGSKEAGTPDFVSVLARSELEGGLRKFLANLSEIDLSRFRVLGGYTRFEEPARNLLKDFRLKVLGAVRRTQPKTENFLLWAPPGSGKTFFVHELAAGLGDEVGFAEINLASTNEAAFRAQLQSIDQSKGSTLAFVDEVDSKPSEPWPYEALLPYLEPPEPRAAARTFLLAGSSGVNIEGLKQGVRERPKGADLLSRIPSANDLSLPAMTREDRILVAVANLSEASRHQGRGLKEVEKLALFYIALNPQLVSPRQLREFVFRGVERSPVGDDRLKFDHFFPAGDPESKEFWVSARSAAPELVGTFVRFKS